MRNVIVIVLVALLFAAPAFAKEKSKQRAEKAPAAKKTSWQVRLPAKDEVAQYLQDISVTVNSGMGEGSGVIKTRERDGKKINFVWTAAHVVDSLRTTEKVIDPETGTERVVVKFDDCQVIKELVENGRRVGELKMLAEVIKYNEEEDLALLRIRKTNFVSASVIFYLDAKIPAIGTDVFHVGSLLGQLGSNSMTSGIISQIGRILDDAKVEYDQTTATSFPGSSGGGVYLKNGAYVGMIVRGAGEGFNLAVPVRRMKKWADRTNILWAMDDNVPLPSEEELEAMPAEDSGHTFKRPAGKKPSKEDFHGKWQDSEFPILFRWHKNENGNWLKKLVPSVN
jgi:S1-C subfamily serine protease